MTLTAQSGVTAAASADAIFLTFNQTDVENAAETIRELLSSLPALQALYRQQFPDANLHLVAAIGSHYWTQLLDKAEPALLAPFPALERAERLAPSTPADLLFHIRSDRHDVNFQLAWTLRERLDAVAELAEEVHGFRYMDSRDMTGFVDGTENPEGDNRARVALVKETDDAEYAAGSYIHLQRYVHKMPLWNRQSLKTQEDTVGRTKQDNIEYAGSDKALSAHTKRTSLKDAEGRSVEILRHSMPYGDAKECGLMFASYCETPANFTAMLESMVVGTEDGHWDHLLKYTRAVTGQAFFAPSVEFLEAL